MTVRSALLAMAGLIAAPLAWAVNMQLGQVLPYADCGARLRWNLVCSVLLLIIAGVAGSVSWRAGSEQGHTMRFVAHVSGLVAWVLVLALLMQGLAGLILTGCER